MPTEAPPAAPPAPPAPPTTPTAPAPAAPGTGPTDFGRTPARQRVAESIRKVAAGNLDSPAKAPATPSASPPTPPAPAATPKAPTPPAAPVKAQETPPEKPVTPTQAPTTPEAPKPLPPDDKKLGPWQLKDKYEKLYKAAETELAKARERISSMGDVQTLQQKFEKTEARLKEAEAKLAHLDAQEDGEFKAKYVKPYEDAWTDAVGELREYQVTLADGTARPANEKDLLQLCNMTRSQGRQLATEMFGDDAGDILRLRDKVVDLAKAQQRGLEDARKAAVERTERQKQIAAEIGQRWEEFVRTDEEKYDFLKPREGDEAWNGKLTEAKEFVDTTLRTLSRLSDVKVNAEDRAEILRRYAAVRGRAIGFPMLRLENKQLRAEVTALKQDLAKFQAGEPAGGEATSTATGSGIVDRMAEAKARIRKMAATSGVTVT